MMRFLWPLAVLLLLALPLGAQEPVKPDYQQWEGQVAAVEQGLGEAAVNDERLSDLRADLVRWRNTFTAAQGLNGGQIETVRSQIAALGPAPAEGQAEDPAIATRRAELNETLARLQAPRIAAGEAASQADGLIRSIDRLVRERQANKLLRLSPSPLNPVNWPAAASLFRWMGAWIHDETVWRFTRPINIETLRNNAPLIAMLVLVAGLLLLRGGRWMTRLTERVLAAGTQMRGRGLIADLAALGQVVLPTLGALTLALALEKTGLFGPILLALFGLFPWLLLLVLTGWWLGARVFAAPGQAGVMAPPDEARGAGGGRIYARMMALALAFHGLLREWIAPRAQDYLGAAGNVGAEKAQEIALRADAALAVLGMPLQILAAIALFRMGQLLRRRVVAAKQAGEDAEFRLRLVSWLGSATILIAVAAPVLGLIGYVSAADALLWPAIMTLGVLALVGLLQGFVAGLYGVLTRREDQLSEDLVPVATGFVLVLLALPVLALIWGARTEDLLELWTRVKSGVSLGGVQISPMGFVTFVVVFSIGLTITRLLQGGLRISILPKTRIDKGGQNAIVSGVGYLGIFLAALLAISSAGIDLSSLAIVAGALSVGIGFGLQNIVSNFVSGIILLIERPISEGDWIEVGTQQGFVKAISVRSTRIQTFDRAEVIVPNTDLISGQVTNWTRGTKIGRVIVPVGVAFGTDTQRVSRILLEIAENHPLVMVDPAPQVLLIGFGFESLNFEVRVFLADVLFKMSVLSDLNHEIVARFAREGIRVPMPQRDIWVRSPEGLRLEASGDLPQPDPATGDAPMRDRPAAFDQGDDDDPGPDGPAR